ncbi:EZH inhibitory protein-like [Bufo gargarizans]|uniref:EZH inhibitory protein-like n=1 Tax=Bufo gargarizans TaxID=30331 RepID=UPI001CF28139|nr:EZH inhibitory protein-like [Bufo gargarizans]
MSELPLSVEEMLELLRREAEVRGPGWLQEQVGACVIAPASAATPIVRAVRPRRGIPPARLSPDCTPRVRRRVGSPSRDPPRRRGSAQPSAGRSRRGRNPSTQRGPERSGTPLPPLSPASPEDAGPGTVDRPSPGPSRRSTQRGDEIHVRRVAQSEQEELCRPSAGAGAAAVDRRPVSIIQRAVRDVREESPSTSRRSAEVEDVRRESGSAAAGITAPVVPVGPVPASCARSGVGGSGVSVVAVGDLGGEVMGLLRDSLSPGFPVALVWILGHSYVFWGAIRADVRPNGG